MKKQLVLMSLLCGTAFCGSSFASSHDARKLQEKCANAAKSADEISRLSVTDQTNVAYCEGYVSSAMDTLATFISTRDDMKACASLPEKPFKELITVVLEYMKNHPEQLSEPGTKVVVTALGKAFKCM